MAPYICRKTSKQMNVIDGFFKIANPVRPKFLLWLQGALILFKKRSSHTRLPKSDSYVQGFPPDTSEEQISIYCERVIRIKEVF